MMLGCTRSKLPRLLIIYKENGGAPNHLALLRIYKENGGAPNHLTLLYIITKGAECSEARVGGRSGDGTDVV